MIVMRSLEYNLVLLLSCLLSLGKTIVVYEFSTHFCYCFFYLLILGVFGLIIFILFYYSTLVFFCGLHCVEREMGGHAWGWAGWEKELFFFLLFFLFFRFMNGAVTAT